MPDEQDRSEALDDELLPDEYPPGRPLAVDGWGDVRIEGVGSAPAPALAADSTYAVRSAASATRRRRSPPARLAGRGTM